MAPIKENFERFFTVMKIVAVELKKAVPAILPESMQGVMIACCIVKVQVVTLCRRLQ
jgi:hypothetical protein